MGKIRLLRTDLPQEPEVTLVTEDADTEVVLGRGTTLRCDDKRVSRNHCSLRILPDGAVVLVARHSNPCFYKEGQSSLFTLLPRNESKTLYQGDEFSLLPESFQYLISMHREHNGDSDPTISEPANVMLDATQVCVDNFEEVDNRHLDTLNETFPVATSTAVTKKTPPQRVLPDWLTNLPPSNNTPPRSEARKRKMEQHKNQMDKKQKNFYNESCKANRNLLTEQTSSMPMSDSRDLIDNAITQPRVASPSLLPLPAIEMFPGNVNCAQSNNKEGYEESWEATGLVRVKIEPGVETHVTAEPAANPVMVKEERIKDEPVEEEPLNDNLNPADMDQGASCSTTTPPAAAATTSSREMCMYGLACYRRNPQHRIDFSHPGDLDYDVAADNLPECKYGTSCYRKNVQHRKDFKHTKKMSPPPQPRPRPTQGNNTAKLGDTSDEDEYDLNDSFLNDASSDDYQPSGSSGSDEDSEGMDDSMAESRPTPEKNKKRKKRKPK